MIQKLLKCRRAGFRFQGLSFDATVKIADAFLHLQSKIDTLADNIDRLADQHDAKQDKVEQLQAENKAMRKALELIIVSDTGVQEK